MYSSGAIRAPVCPTWSECGRQPRLVTTREPPTAPPSRLASSSSGSKPSLLPTPRPPPITTLAVSSRTAPAGGPSRRETRGSGLDGVRRDRKQLRRAAQARLLEETAAPTLTRQVQKIAVERGLD